MGYIDDHITFHNTMGFGDRRHTFFQGLPEDVPLEYRSVVTTLECRAMNLNILSDKITELCNLEHLWCWFNQMKTLPHSIGNLTNLCLLDCSNNLFNELPLEICQLKLLDSLYFTDNALKILPPNICQLSHLRILDCSNNLLTQIPPEIGQMTCLQKLYCSHNQLTELPREMLDMPNLWSVDFSNNLMPFLVGHEKDWPFIREYLQRKQ
mgnify:CR=1 FL=1